MAVENQTADAVKAEVRQARSQDAWAVVEAAAGARADLAPCLQMVLSVGSADYRVSNGAGALLCEGTSMIAAGKAPVLVVAGDGNCTMASEP